jgi:hypothetical protein
LEYPKDSRPNRLLKCLTVKFCRSTWLVQILSGRGLPAFTLTLTPINGAGEYRRLASIWPGVSAKCISVDAGALWRQVFAENETATS